MSDTKSEASVPQVPIATASNPFPKMTKEEKVHFVINKKKGFPKKTFFGLIFLILIVGSIFYIVNRNQKNQTSQINDVQEPSIQISSPENGDTLSGLAEIVVFLEDNTFNQKAYQTGPEVLEVTNSQPKTTTITPTDNLEK